MKKLKSRELGTGVLSKIIYWREKLIFSLLIKPARLPIFLILCHQSHLNLYFFQQIK